MSDETSFKVGADGVGGSLPTWAVFALLAAALAVIYWILKTIADGLGTAVGGAVNAAEGAISAAAGAVADGVGGALGTVGAAAQTPGQAVDAILEAQESDRRARETQNRLSDRWEQITGQRLDEADAAAYYRITRGQAPDTYPISWRVARALDRTHPRWRTELLKAPYTFDASR